MGPLLSSLFSLLSSLFPVLSSLLFSSLLFSSLLSLLFSSLLFSSLLFSSLLLLQCTSYHSAGLSLMSPVPSAYLQRSRTTAIFRPAATRCSSSLKAALESISQDLNVALFCPLPLRFRRNCFGNLGYRKCCRIRVWFLRVASEPRLALFMSLVLSVQRKYIATLPTIGVVGNGSVFGAALTR